MTEKEEMRSKIKQKKKDNKKTNGLMAYLNPTISINTLFLIKV